MVMMMTATATADLEMMTSPGEGATTGSNGSRKRTMAAMRMVGLFLVGVVAVAVGSFCVLSAAAAASNSTSTSNSYSNHNPLNNHRNNHRNLAHLDTKSHHELVQLRKIVASLEGQIERRNRMTEIRAYKQVGPIPLDILPNFEEYKSVGGALYLRPDKNLPLWMDSTKDGCVGSQVPQASFDTWTKTGKFNCVDGLPWTVEIVDELVALANANTDYSPHDYPKCVVDFYNAFKKYPIQGKNVLVVGSISPWVEAILISRGAASIKTIDYNSIDTRDPRLQVLTIPAFKESFIHNGPETDVIVSFSSIEHDGLGRYGDPLSPNGDMAAVQEMWEWLKPGGMLFLGIPVAMQGGVQGNLHRFFGKDRINQLATNWEQIDTFHSPKPGFSVPAVDVTNDLWRAWKNQPIFVWRKPSEQLVRSTGVLL